MMYQFLTLLTYLFSHFMCSQEQAWLPIRIEFQFLAQYPAEKLAEIQVMMGIAKQFFANSLLVQRSTKPLRFDDSAQLECEGFDVGPEVRKMEFDADLVFLVILQDLNTAVAFSGPCVLSNTNKPIFSILGFGGTVSDNKSTGNIEFQNNLIITVHEFMHGLGFYDTLFGKFMDSFTKKIHPITTITKEGVLYLATPRLLQYTREYFGCADAFGVPMEDQGHQGQKNTHWERRLFFNELMIAQDQTGDLIFSIFSFKLLEDTGWYKLGDISVDPMTFGKNQGCDFLQKGCLGGDYPEFCDESQAGSNFQCTWTSTGIGGCSVDKYSNTCKMTQMYYNEDCRDPLDLSKEFVGENLQDTYDSLQTFAYDSRCFNASFTNSSKKNYFDKQCHKFKCSDDLASLIVYVGGDTLNCTQDNLQLISAELSGSMQCPNNISQFCYQYAECPNQCNKRGFCVDKKCICMKGYHGPACDQTCTTYRTSQGSCVKSCPFNTFADVHTLTCLGCPFGCAKCVVVGTCTICKDGYILHHGSCENSYQFDTLLGSGYNLNAMDNDVAILEIPKSVDSGQQFLRSIFWIPFVLITI